MNTPNPLAIKTACETKLSPPAVGKHTRFIRFLVTGATAAVVNVLARWLLEFVVKYEVAVALAYLVGMTTAFFLARAYVFQAESDHVHKQYVRFALVNAIAFVQVWIVSVGLLRFIFPLVGFTNGAETVAHIIGVVSPVATSYIGHSKFSFKSPNQIK